MVFWQLTIDANDPARLARFWAQALGYQQVPPDEPETAWQAHYRSRLGGQAAFDDRLFDPDGVRPPLWFQPVPETKAGKNRLHLDLYPTGRDNALPLERRIEMVEAKVAELAGLGRQCGATGPGRRSGEPGLLRRHARSGGERVPRRLSVAGVAGPRPRRRTP